MISLEKSKEEFAVLNTSMLERTYVVLNRSIK